LELTFKPGMREITERNLAFLEREHPHVFRMVREGKLEQQADYVRGTRPNIVLNKRHYHAPRNPEQEAQNLVADLHVREGALYVFMGIGIGYHIVKFRELYGVLLPKITVVCIERSVSAFRALAYHHDISFLKGMHLSVGNDTDRIDKLIRGLNPLSFSGYRIVKLRGGFSLFEEYYDRIETLFKEFMSGRLSDLLTMYAFDSLWMKNMIDNMPRLVGKSSILSLKDVAMGRPAIVVGAGPSLRFQLDTIAGVRDRIAIIAVDTALESLLLFGIEPDFVVAIDAQQHNFLDFFSCLMGEAVRRRTVLVSDLIVYPKILNHWSGPLYFSSTAHPAESVYEDRAASEESFFTAFDGVYQDVHPIVSKFKSFYGPAGWLRCGGSVATTAIEFAIHIGSNPVLLAGLDFSYTQYMTHVHSSPSYNLHYRDSNRLSTLSTAFVRSLSTRKTVWCEGIDKRSVLTDFIFQNYLSWFRRSSLERKSEYEGRVLNATSQGAVLPGIEWVELDRYVRRFHGCEKKPVCVSSLLQKPLQKPVARRFLLSVKREVGTARAMITENSDSETLKADLMNRFTFLQNSVALTSRLFKERKKVRINLLLLLSMLEKRAERSLERIEKQ
jgi:hypothetical protein